MENSDGSTMGFKNKKYNIIYADPPWSFDNKKTGGSMKSGALHHYETMKAHELCAFSLDKDYPVTMLSDVIADDCTLFMWWVASMPEIALLLVEDWGFKLKTMTGFVWNKTTKNGNPHFGMGFWTRAGSECCLIATRGKSAPVSHSIRSVITAPVLAHSQKPHEAANRIVELCGDIPRIELFARDKKEGWDAWGNGIGMSESHQDPVQGRLVFS